MKIGTPITPISWGISMPKFVAGCSKGLMETNQTDQSQQYVHYTSSMNL